MTPYAWPDQGHCPPPLVPSLRTTHSCSWPDGLLILLPSHDAAWHFPVDGQHLPMQMVVSAHVHARSGPGEAQLPEVHLATAGGICGAVSAVQLAATPYGLAPGQPQILKLSLLPDSMQKTPSAESGHVP